MFSSSMMRLREGISRSHMFDEVANASTVCSPTHTISRTSTEAWMVHRLVKSSWYLGSCQFMSFCPDATLDPNQLLHVGSVQDPSCEGPNPSELRVLSEPLGDGCISQPLRPRVNNHRWSGQRPMVRSVVALRTHLRYTPHSF